MTHRPARRHPRLTLTRTGPSTARLFVPLPPGPSALVRRATAFSADTLAVDDALADTADTTESDTPGTTGTTDAPELPGTWSGVLATEGELTGDGRFIEKGALTWDTDNPLPLRHVESDVGEHKGAKVAGHILTISRTGTGQTRDITATGDFDLDGPTGIEAHRQVGADLQNGVSLDLDEVAFEVRVAKEVVEEMDALLDGMIVDDTEDTDGDDSSDEDDADSDTPEREADENGRVTVAKFAPDDEVMVMTSAIIRAATLVSIPAFRSARIALTASAGGDDGITPGTGAAKKGPGPVQVRAAVREAGESAASVSGSPADTPDAAAHADSLRASAAPDAPPQSWFTDPGLDAPTALTVTDEGRIYGHLAAFGTCHTAYPGQCVTPPTSAAEYAYFHTGVLTVTAADGKPASLSVGRITLDTTHAKPAANGLAALRHYEKTGLAIADVRCGEDGHGIWIAGALRPTATSAQVRELKASPLSGDWRDFGGNLELVAALAVNVPGFPVPRPQGLVASGRTQSLVASGMLPPKKVIAPGSPGALSTEDLRYLRSLAAREKRRHLDEMTRRAHIASLSARVGAARRLPPATAPDPADRAPVGAATASDTSTTSTTTKEA